MLRENCGMECTARDVQTNCPSQPSPLQVACTFFSESRDLEMNDNYANVVAYDSTGYFLYGTVLKFPLRQHSDKLRMEGLNNFLGMRLMLKDGTEIVPDSAGYSNVSFPANGEVVEVCALAPPAFARKKIPRVPNEQETPSKPASERRLFVHCLPILHAQFACFPSCCVVDDKKTD